MYSLKKYYPVKTNDLIRIGRNRDGGYIINERVIKKTETLVGLGISIDWSFEEEFKKKNKQIKIFAFDYSISFNIFLQKAKESITKLFRPDETTKTGIKKFFYPFLYLNVAFGFKDFFDKKKGNFFFKEGIDKSTHDVFISVDEMFSRILEYTQPKPDSIFLKVDIELSEYNVMQLIKKYVGYINSMVIEFHALSKYWQEFENIMNSLMNDYVIVHIHGNNFVGYIAGTQTPDCIELTITKKSLITNEELNAVNTKTYPVKNLDYPCYNKWEDLRIGFD